jgi:hypothetical protein
MKTYFYLLIGISLYSCSNNSSSEDKEQSSSQTVQLADSLFVLRNIDNSLIVNNFWCDPKTNYELYSDSISKKLFVKLDSAQKQKLIVPIIIKELPIDANYVIQNMRALFISKQKQIGDYTPIIVWVDGDDFGALYYVTLDKELNIISYFKMNGGEEGGPSYGADSTMELPTIRHSYINGNEIHTYTLTEFVKPDSIKHPSIFDSVNYVSNILPSGQIETKRIDSVRFKRMSKY